jgi:threonylcarbamoyladenosine tRNA methylthiotransferase MtaB
MKKCALLTFGCKVNQHETQGILEACERQGLEIVGPEKEADVFIINTCSVTEKAESQALKEIRKLRRSFPESEIIVTGCIVDRKHKQFDGAMLVPNRQKYLIPRLACEPDMRASFIPCFDGASADLPISRFEGHTRAFIKVQDGCDYNCSFCKIPQARGRSASRPLEEIIEEAKRLISNGYKELVITGVCVGSYGRELQHKKSLCDVISSIAKLTNTVRIRISSIELSDIKDELIAAMARYSNVCRHLHIPLQSGSDRILSLMRRHYTLSKYLKTAADIRKDLPGVQFSTDMITGFPSESEEDARLSEKALTKLKPIRSHFFPYSSRPHTLAAKMSEKIPPCIVKTRMERLKKIQSHITRDILKSLIGKKLSVLVEGHPDPKNSFFEGYSDTYIKCFIKGSNIRPNVTVAIRANSASDRHIFGSSS